MKHYRKVDETHHLSSYEVMLPIWNGLPPTLRPFEVWKPHRGIGNVQVSLPWYRAYNESKHDRHSNFKKANLGNLINAVAGLLVLLTSQFGEHEFSAGRGAIGLEDGGVDQMNPATGSLFRIRYPNDWADSELYDFDWSQIRSQADRFNKLNYDLIPC
jgi:hypothetical protein